MKKTIDKKEAIEGPQPVPIKQTFRIKGGTRKETVEAQLWHERRRLAAIALGVGEGEIEEVKE
jgi:hypothetical protein